MGSNASNFRIAFVPGLRPKPHPEVYADALLRCIVAGLARVEPRAASLLREAPGSFVLYPWTYAVYGEHRDFELDREGVERLLANPDPTQTQIDEIETLSRRAMRWTHRVADTLPIIGRYFVTDRTEAALDDARRYLHDRDGVGTRTRHGLHELLERLHADGCYPIVIGHSLGSVIAYDTLWEMSRRNGLRIELFMTIGSPLATRFVRKHLKGADRPLPERFPSNIRRWANFSAKGELMSLYPRLSGYFPEMQRLGLVESFEDHDGLYNHFEGAGGLNVHEAYGYVIHRNFARRLADTLLELQR